MHGLDQRIIFVKHLVKKTDEFIEFAAFGAHGHAGAHLTGLENIAHCLD